MQRIDANIGRVTPSRVLCENGMPGNEGDTYLPPRWSPTRGSPRDREKRKFWPRVHLAAGAAPYTSFELASRRNVCIRET